MHYLLFLPGKSAANPQNLHDVGLGALLRGDDDPPVYTDLVGPGPGDLSGQIVSWFPARPAYNPGAQEWFPAVPDPVRGLPAGRYWIGIDPLRPPTPEGIARRMTVSGSAHLVTGEHRWAIPSILNLPCRLSLCVTTGSRLRIPRPEYDDWRREADLAFGLVQRYLEGEPLPADLDERFELAVRLMQLNYRLTREVATRWGPLQTDEHELQALVHALDRSALFAALEAKKKACTIATPELSPLSAGDGG